MQILNVKVLSRISTPLFQTGLVILLNGILLHLKGNSVISNLRWKFLYLMLLSVVAWTVFEWANIFLSNWQYKNAITPPFLRSLYYIWSFSAIFPSAILSFELLYHYNFFRSIQVNRIKINLNMVLAVFFSGIFIVRVEIFLSSLGIDFIDFLAISSISS